MPNFAHSRSRRSPVPLVPAALAASLLVTLSACGLPPSDHSVSSKSGVFQENRNSQRGEDGGSNR